MKTNQNKDIFFTKLAFYQAELNLGSTGTNPSVGCVIVKNNSVISSAQTSFMGRPHAEANALKNNLNYKDSDLYSTLEPCCHSGKTSPCVQKIIEKKIKRVHFSINDVDARSKNKAKNKLKKKNIIVKRNSYENFAKEFYKSYFLQFTNQPPLVDSKLAISKDYFSINKKNNWITNLKSRNLGNFLRSKYNCLLTTSKTINNDNPSLDCRIEGLENKSPILVIIDRFFKIKKNLNILRIKNRKIYIFTTAVNKSKEKFFKRKGVKIIKMSSENIKPKKILYRIKKLGLNRILVETGSSFLCQLLKLNLVNNLFLFKSSKKLLSNGKNNSSFALIKKVNIYEKNKIKVNLDGDNLYKVKL